MHYTAVLAPAILALAELAQSATPTQCFRDQYTPVPQSQQPKFVCCGSKGFLNSPVQLGFASSPVSSDACVAYCKNSDGCVSFSYAAANQTCTLYAKRLVDQDYRRPKVDRGVLFYSAKCYGCASCPTDESVSNGDFSQTTEDGSGFVDWTTTSPDTVHDDGGNPGWNPPGGDLSQQVKCVDVGVPYKFSADYYTYGPRDQIKITVDGQTVVSCEHTFDPAHAFVCDPFNTTFVPQNPSPVISVQVNSPSVGATVDNVSLKRMADSG